MIRIVFAAALIASTAASGAVDPQTTAAFRAAFGKSGSAILKLQGEYKESVKYTPGGLIEAPFGPVLISPGEVVVGASHAAAGKLAVIYLKHTPHGFAVVKRFVPATETGSFGVIGKWRASRAFGSMPMVMVEGGGTWQGCSSNWMTLLEIAPEKPRELVTIYLGYDYDGGFAADAKATRIHGRIARIVPGKSFDVAYSGSRKFTERYVRRGDAYVLAGGGETKMETC